MIFQTYREWRASFESILAYGKAMGWMRSGDETRRPELSPMPDHSKLRQKLHEEEEKKRKLMGG